MGLWSLLNFFRKSPVTTSAPAPIKRKRAKKSRQSRFEQVESRRLMDADPLFGRRESLLILQRLYALLHRQVLSVEGFECLVTRVERAETDALFDALTMRGSLRVQVVLAQELV